MPAGEHINLAFLITCKKIVFLILCLCVIVHEGTDACGGRKSAHGLLELEFQASVCHQWGCWDVNLGPPSARAVHASNY